MIIGGEDVFREVLPQVGRIYLTEVHAAPHADTWFPELDMSEWREVFRERSRSRSEGRPCLQLRGSRAHYACLHAEGSPHCVALVTSL